MRKISYVLVFVSFLSCKVDKTESVVNDLRSEVNRKDTLDIKPKSIEKIILSTDWQDDLIIKYIKFSKDEFLQSAVKSKKRIQWMQDDSQKNDSTQFYIYRIGFDETDENGESLRFSTCKWIYLDSVKRKLYEYDLPNDTIVEWKK
jgi:hypothetical protein